MVTEDDVKNEMRAVAKLCMAQHIHKNIISVFDYGPLSHFLYFIDMELCDLNLDRWIYRTWTNPQRRDCKLNYPLVPEWAKFGILWRISPAQSTSSTQHVRYIAI